MYAQACGSPSGFVSRYWDKGWVGFAALTNEQNITSGIQSVTVPNTKAIHIVARGSGGQLRYLKYDSLNWHPWETLASCIQESPSITNIGDNNLMIVYRGCDGNLYQINGTKVAGQTIMSSTLSSQPNGYSDKVTYDNLYRTIRDFDKAGLSSRTNYHPYKDVVYSTVDPLGLKSTTVYDRRDVPVENYGPAPEAWYGADGRRWPPLPRKFQNRNKVR